MLQTSSMESSLSEYKAQGTASEYQNIVGEAPPGQKTDDHSDGDVEEAEDPRKKDAAYISQLQEDAREQDELQDAYGKMLYMNDPDDVEKEEQLAWLKMEAEDRGFMRKQHIAERRSKRMAGIQISDIKHRIRMLNRHDAQKTETPSVARQISPPKVASAADSGELAD